MLRDKIVKDLKQSDYKDTENKKNEFQTSDKCLSQGKPDWLI